MNQRIDPSHSPMVPAERKSSPPALPGAALLLLGTALGSGPVLGLACAPPAGSPAEPAATEWLSGSMEQRMQRVEEHLGGFGVAMWEVGYRYGELHFAGQDENWGLALHQIEEIREVMELGLERRPKYAAAAPVMDESLTAVEAAAAASDAAAFATAFNRLTTACNTCHVMTDHAYVYVAPPERRQSVLVRPPR